MQAILMATIALVFAGCGACGVAQTEALEGPEAVVEVGTSTCGWQLNRCARECAAECGWEPICARECERERECTAMGHAPEDRICIGSDAGLSDTGI